MWGFGRFSGSIDDCLKLQFCCALRKLLFCLNVQVRNIGHFAIKRTIRRLTRTTFPKPTRGRMAQADHAIFMVDNIRCHPMDNVFNNVRAVIEVTGGTCYMCDPESNMKLMRSFKTLDDRDGVLFVGTKEDQVGNFEGYEITFRRENVKLAFKDVVERLTINLFTISQRLQLVEDQLEIVGDQPELLRQDVIEMFEPQQNLLNQLRASQENIALFHEAVREV